MPPITAIPLTYRTPIAALLAAVLFALALRGWRASYALDAALIAAYAIQPRAFVLAAVLTVWRYTPFLANDIASLVGAEQAIGLTRAFWRVVLVGWQDAPAPQPKAATGKTVALSSPAMPLRALLIALNADPDRVPHTAIIGPSGSGKTTLATVVLSERPGLIVVLTAKEGDAWGGLPYVGIDDDATYTTAQQTFAALDSEVKQRLLSIKQQGDPGDWLTIVLDDFSALQSECPAAPAVVKLVARLGRALHLRLILLSDSALVKAIGMEGEGETRGNFAFVRLERGHSATLELAGPAVPVDLRGADRWAATVQLGGRAWGVSVPVPAAADSSVGTVPGTGNGNGTGNGTPIAVLRALRAAGWTREQARGSGCIFRDSDWTEAGKI